MKTVASDKCHGVQQPYEKSKDLPFFGDLHFDVASLVGTIIHFIAVGSWRNESYTFIRILNVEL